MKKILVIDDDRSICRTLELHLGRTMRVHTAHTADEGLEKVEAESPDVVLLDIRLPGATGLDMLERIKALDNKAYTIIITALQDMETTIEAIHKGAFDYIPKPINMDELELSIKRAFQDLYLHRRLTDLQVEMSREYTVDTIIGKSRAMQEIFKTIALASQGKATVLIQGESGTGKELVARAIHHNSPEKDGPFTAINCSALVETLLESELFGHEKGAFTGALYRKEGKLEMANGGTVLLDEVGDMSPTLQVKLLRFLQERSFERVGGKETIKTDVRVVAATNRDLDGMIKEGLFREDLFYRLKVITVDVPPLRERKEDIPLLVSHLLTRANREQHRTVTKVPYGVTDALIAYSWPGNVRELENVITRAVLLSKGDVLQDVHIPGLREREEAPGDAPPWEPGPLDEMERVHIERVLDHTDWNKSKAAALLGVSLPRLMRKIKKYELRRKPPA
ncbi:MAG: sigma-54 dependent transcriptional regulator [Thermodesulfobacteriota bacterium]